MSSSSIFSDVPLTPEQSGANPAFGTTQSLYRKYRPQSFGTDDLVGQEAIVRTLQNAIRLDRVAHAYLFTGPRGTGKTTTARLLAKAVNCLDPDPNARPCNHCAACIAINSGSTTDIIEIDAASNRGIDDIRELRERVKFAPTFLKTKFYIVDEAHQITGAAANAFLKTLEEPPPHTKFILATTDPEQLLPTIVSRCQRFDFKRFSRATIVDHLAHVAEQEHISIDRDALAVIGEHAGGSMRDALGLLDQIASYRAQEDTSVSSAVSADDARNLLGVARGERVVRLVDALADNDAGAGLAIINEAFEAGEEPRQLNRQLVSLLRAIMFQRAANTPGGDPDVDRLAQRFSLGTIAAHSARFSEIDHRIRHASLPQLPLEIAFVQATLESEPATNRVTQESRTQYSTGAASRPHPTTTESSAPTRQPTTPSARRSSTPPDAAPTQIESASAKQPTRPANTPPPEQPRPTPTTGVVLTVDTLHDLWPKIRLDIKARDRRIEALISSCDPLRVEGNSIVLVTSYKFHWEKMNEDATRDLLQTVIGRLVGQPVTVTTEMRGSNPAQPPHNSPTPEPNRGQTNTSPPPVRTDPVVQPSDDDRTVLEAAQNIFDAEAIKPTS